MKLARSTRLMRFTFAALTASAFVFAASCGDSSPVAPPTQAAPPSAAVQGDALGGLAGALNHTVNSLLLTCSPLPAATTSKTIGPMGGVIAIGPHSLIIPPGALSSNTTITASIVNGGHNGVHFEPHGLEFKHSAALTMSYANCSGVASLLPKHIAYVDGNLNILEILLSLDDLWSNNVTGKLDHFSDYMVAW